MNDRTRTELRGTIEALAKTTAAREQPWLARSCSWLEIGLRSEENAWHVWSTVSGALLGELQRRPEDALLLALESLLTAYLEALSGRDDLTVFLSVTKDLVREAEKSRAPQA